MGKPAKQILSGLGKSGWMMSLRDEAESTWGDVDSFYNYFAGTAGFASDVWGKYVGREMPPESGEGIAFYHNSRAAFPKNDLFKRRPRISLVGFLRKVECAGREVNRIEGDHYEDILDALQKRPLLREPRSIHIFEAARMVQGNVATFYWVPPDAWRNLLGLLSKSL